MWSDEARETARDYLPSRAHRLANWRTGARGSLGQMGNESRSVRWRRASSEDLQEVNRASRPAGSPPLVLVRGWRDGVAVATLMLGLMAAVGGVAAGRAALAGAAEGKARPPRVVPIGTYGVGKIDETFVDASRPTNANGSSPELASRTLRTAIYYPALVPPGGDAIPNAPPRPPGKSGRYPLILFSHGLGGHAMFYVEVLKSWASAGYVVAAPAYPLSNINADGGFIRANGFADAANQPADATFVINQVLERQEALLGGIVDPKRIGASGHSFGGGTTYALGYSTCCRDRHVKAAIPMSACAGVVQDPGGYFRDNATPLLILHGDADPRHLLSARRRSLCGGEAAEVRPHLCRRGPHRAVHWPPHGRPGDGADAWHGRFLGPLPQGRQDGAKKVLDRRRRYRRDQIPTRSQHPWRHIVSVRYGSAGRRRRR